MSDTNDKSDRPSHGVVVRARNGDVIRYDPTGLVMRLSDKVIEDIALRLGDSTAPTPRASTAPAPTEPAEITDFDAWDVRADGDWLRFHARLPGAQGPRGFLRRRDGGAILADAPGPVLGILGLGGPGAALAIPGPGDFPQHVVGLDDDIGAVGMAGVEDAPLTDRLDRLRERPHVALVGEALLHGQMARFAPLPLIVARTETDASASAADLATGAAVANLIRAAENLKASAETLGKKAKILAICLDYGLEDTLSDATAYRDGMLAVMQAVSDALWTLGFDTPRFVMTAASGLPDLPAPNIVAGQWELSWNHADHDLRVCAPEYAFTRDAYDRPTDHARIQCAEITAAALSDDTWRPPILHLAEREDGDKTIRVTAQSETPLTLDTTNPFGAADAGFTLTDAGKAQIKAVEIAPDDDKALLIRCTAPVPQGAALHYATTGPGALRDGWTMDSRTGTTLHRWALPAILPVNGGRYGA